MTARLYDAHNHLAEPVFDAHRAEIEASLKTIGMERAVVNGTCPEDWPLVLGLAVRDPRVVPAIGLHPWKVNHAPADWRERFLGALDSGARAIGEIGLDQWIAGHQIERQQEAFRWQLTQAAERDLPVSIHCLKAVGPLMDTLRSATLPARGIHLHAFKASEEIIGELVALGAYFSFNGKQMAPGRSGELETIRLVPEDRLLIETDAPDMLPPAELREFDFEDGPSGQAVNHPGNLRAAYRRMAEIRGCPLERLVAVAERNYRRYFK